MKEHHEQVPPTKLFPDGDYITYWRDSDGLVWLQLFRKNGKPIGSKARYYGNTP